MKFNEMKLSDNIMKALEDIGYDDATTIQEKAIPLVLDGKDIIGKSKTGTGKTAAFGLPIIERLNNETKKVQAIILCPTRELSLQVAEEIEKYIKYCNDVKVLCIYGGQNIERQIIPLRRGVQIVVGTPGRVMDHLRRKTLKLDEVKTLVLDEADEMLNMGFQEDIETILESVNKQRQTLLFSATMNKKILNITNKYLTNPVNIEIKSDELTVKNIDQLAIETKGKMKDEGVIRLLEFYRPSKAVVFCNTKKKVDTLVEILKAQGYKTEGLHSDIRQEQRTRIMQRIKNDELKILVATDVAARGLDIKDLDLVINYDIPLDDEYYVHRIGRTGRNGANGLAVTFVVGKERNRLEIIQRYTGSKIKYVSMPTITEVNEIKKDEIIAKIQKMIDNSSIEDSELYDQLLANNNNDVEKIAKALFNIVIPKKQEVKADSSGFVKLFLTAGKSEKISAKDIVGSFAANTAMSGTDIGKISVMDKFSFVEVPKKYLEEIMATMDGNQIKGKRVKIEIAKE
ncbi:MAG: DEAD/DEAH box helicase [Clostridia bacterium]